MKFELNKQEYRTLIEMLYVADWVIGDSEDETNQDSRGQYEQLIQKISSHFREAECDDLIEYDEEVKRFFPTIALEESSFARECIDEYEMNSFWRELLDRLTFRDIMQNNGNDTEFQKLSKSERFEKFQELYEKYEDEFEKHGIDRLFLLENDEG